MSPAVVAFHSLARAWADLAWAVYWQSAIVVGAFAVVALGLRRSSPGLRYWLWQIAAIKLLAMPLWCLSIDLPATARRDAGPPPGARTPARSRGEIGVWPAEWSRALGQGATAEGPPPGVREGRPWLVSADWRSWLLTGWGLALAVQVIAIVHQRNRLERLLRRASPADDPALLALVAELSGRIGLRRPPETRIADGQVSPFVCGLRRPVLVLPRGLADSLDLDPLRSVLLHELAHLRRHDLLWDWIPAVARLLYVFHPAAHYIAHRARLERELACDQAAMVLTGQDAAGYASTLVTVVSRSSAPPALRAALTTSGLESTS